MASQREQTAAQRALATDEILSIILNWIKEDGDWWLDDPNEDKYSDDEDEENDMASAAGDDSVRIELERLGLRKYVYGFEGVLLRCALVNRLWNAEAVPLLWSDIDFWDYGMSMPLVFGRIDPLRRQYFANLAKDPKLTAVDKDSAADVDAGLRGASFPNLRAIYLRLPPSNNDHIPRIDAPGVVELFVDPPFDIYPDSYYIYGDQWDVILDDIAVRPTLHAALPQLDVN